LNRSTCYGGAGLQVLESQREFFEHVITGNFDGPVTKALQNLWEKKRTASSPEELTKLLREFYKCLHVNVRDKNWKSETLETVMQDCGEFLQLLLALIHDEQASQRKLSTGVFQPKLRQFADSTLVCAG
jgi:hypothetical protein